MSYNVNDLVVYPGHGVSRIVRTNNKHLTLLTPSGLNIIVPHDNVTYLGIRTVTDKDTALSILMFINSVDRVPVETSTWNRRYRVFMEDIMSGDLLRIATVYKSLIHLRVEKDLSFGERKMLNIVKELLETELSISLNQKVEL